MVRIKKCNEGKLSYLWATAYLLYVYILTLGDVIDQTKIIKKPSYTLQKNQFLIKNNKKNDEKMTLTLMEIVNKWANDDDDDIQMFGEYL